MTVDEFDLDRSVSRAWAGFRQRLTDTLDLLDDDDLLLIEAGPVVDDAEGSVPFAQILAAGPMLRAELSSNAFLAAQFTLDDAGSAALAGLGWRPPGVDSPNFEMVVDRGHTDQLAALVVAAFRDTWNVPHPTFLEAGHHNAALGITRDPRPSDAPEPASRAHIQHLVDETLTRHLGELPRKDGDGDIPVRSGSALVFISVLEDLPLVELKSPLVVDIEGRTRAAEIIADLNATWRQAKFVLIRDVVVLLLELPTEPFVPQHLLGALEYISRLADQLDDELAERLGGRLPFGDQPTTQPRIAAGDLTAAADLPPELVALLRLAGDRGRALPADVAALCADDRDRILQLLNLCTAQEISWRRSADEARVDGATSTATSRDDEADVWQDLVELLRTALHEVLVRDHHGDAAGS